MGVGEWGEMVMMGRRGLGGGEGAGGRGAWGGGWYLRCIGLSEFKPVLFSLLVVEVLL